MWRWLRDEEPDHAPLDRGGFTDFFDAFFFATGVNLIRAEAGELGSIMAADIEAERTRAERLESRQGIPPPAAELDAFGLFGAYERRKLHPRDRRRWHADRALRLVAAL